MQIAHFDRLEMVLDELLNKNSFGNSVFWVGLLSNLFIVFQIIFCICASIDVLLLGCVVVCVCKC